MSPEPNCEASLTPKHSTEPETSSAHVKDEPALTKEALPLSVTATGDEFDVVVSA